MEWVTNLEGQVVGIDTAPIIYLIQENPRYLATVRPFFEAIDRGECQSVTSAVTLIEVLIHPLRQESPNLANQYRNILLHSNGLACIPISLDIAAAAAQLRADYNIRTQDAIQLATALHEGATAFLTNDAGLPSLPNLRVILLDELVQENQTPI